MSVEHRWSNRKELTMEVNLYYPPLGVISARTRNISLEGMFVELQGVDIPAQSRLEVVFQAKTRHGKAEHRLPAFVVYQGDEGIGIMLQHVGYSEFDALRYMVNAA